MDSVVMAEEIMAAWQCRGTKGFIWKLDFVKAYDSIDWRFIWVALRCHGFSETWVMVEAMRVHKHLRCRDKWPAVGWMDISPERNLERMPTSSSSLHPGSRYTGSVHGEEVRARLLARFQTIGWPGGVPLLQYANDMIFFMEGSVEAAEKVSTLLDMFYDFSGLN